MTFEQLLIPVLMAVGGWFARHYGLLAPTDATPQTAQGARGTSPLGPVPSDLPSMIESIVDAAVKRGIARLEARLSPSQPVHATPQT